MKRSNKNPNRLKLRRTCKKLNQIMTATEEVPPELLTHYPEGGLRGLIERILRTHGATWLGDIQLPADRAAAIEAAIYTTDIHDQVRKRFTAQTTRYPQQSIKNCLVEMRKAGEVGKIKLSTEEDSPRDCPRPRCKWYWAWA
jgi:hypothetical protein